MQRSIAWRWLCSRRSPSISNVRSINRFPAMAKPTFRSLHQDLFPKHDLKAWSTIPASNDLPSYAILEKEIIKPEVDNREYRYIKLENDLEVLLIHDADADKSAASMDVEVGHLHDPVSQFMLGDFAVDLSFAFIGRSSRLSALLRASIVYGMVYRFLLQLMLTLSTGYRTIS